jgi:hypothetical protein
MIDIPAMIILSAIIFPLALIAIFASVVIVRHFYFN